MIKKVINSFIFAGRGLLTTWKEEHNFRIEVFAGIAVIFCIFYFDFSFVESVFCIIAITIVLASEIVNTAVEDLCNKIEPNYDPTIGKIKDTMGAFVTVSAFGALVVGILVFCNHFLLY